MISFTCFQAHEKKIANQRVWEQSVKVKIMWIYIAHSRSISDVLIALVQWK